MRESSRSDDLLATTEPAPCDLRDVPITPSRTLKATPVFDTYWRFAARRQDLFMRRVLAAPPPRNTDPVLKTYRFTNAYRAADRVSQYLIRHVLYAGEQTSPEIFFRCMLFKLFNKIETWEHLCAQFGPPATDTFDPDRYTLALDRLVDSRTTVYSAAYIMPCPPFDQPRKHGNHLRLLDLMLRTNVPRRIHEAHSLQEVYGVLEELPSIGPFLAFQFAIDLNYSAMLDFSEMDFVVAGPGAQHGIRKCFADTAGLDEADLIRAVSDLSESEFERHGLRFRQLWGRRLHLIDYQKPVLRGRQVRPRRPSDSARAVEADPHQAALRPRPPPAAAVVPAQVAPRPPTIRRL